MAECCEAGNELAKPRDSAELTSLFPDFPVAGDCTCSSQQLVHVLNEDGFLSMVESFSSFEQFGGQRQTALQRVQPVQTPGSSILSSTVSGKIEHSERSVSYHPLQSEMCI